jgi:hypothetical protein
MAHFGNKNALRHGYRHTPTYQTWIDMRRRCVNPRHRFYPNYGGRGIAVCHEWATSFEAFLRDMGEKPAGKSLDRIDNDGNYEPGNCRWATQAEQSRNRSQSIRLTLDGQTKVLKDWARDIGMHASTLRERLVRGWSAERALTEPVRKEHAPK